MVTIVDAFLLGWRSARDAGQITHMLVPEAPIHQIFAAMTMPDHDTVMQLIEVEFPVVNDPLKEHSIG